MAVPLFFICCKTRQQPVKDTVRQVVVSFYSVGSGTNREAIYAMNNLIREYQEQQGLPLIVEKKPWGREGEVDYCVDLQKVDDNSAREFINKLHSYLDKQNWVRIKENTTCKEN